MLSLKSPTRTATLADLAVAMTGPPSAVFTNDWMVYGVNVTNLGPSFRVQCHADQHAAYGRGIFKCFAVQPGCQLRGSNVIFNLGTLASGAFTNLQLTVQPTNAGVLDFFIVCQLDQCDRYKSRQQHRYHQYHRHQLLSRQFGGFTNSGQTIDFQNALTEQSITVSNAGAASVAAVRVVVTGLTNQLFNAVGTNNGNPFVVYHCCAEPEPKCESAAAILSPELFSVYQWTVARVCGDNPNLAPPVAAATSTNIYISHILRRCPTAACC